jgi:hypothetical protein
MKWSPSWEANICLASQEFPQLLWNPKIYYHVQKSLSSVPILCQMNLIHTSKSYVPKIHFNIVLSSMPRSSKWSLPFRLSNQNFVRISHLAHASFDMLHSSYPTTSFNVTMGWDHVCVELQPLMGPLSIPQMIHEWIWMVEWYWQGKLKDSEKNLSQCHFSHYRSHMDWPGCKPGPPWWEAIDWLPVLWHSLCPTTYIWNFLQWWIFNEI